MPRPSKRTRLAALPWGDAVLLLLLLVLGIGLCVARDPVRVGEEEVIVGLLWFEACVDAGQARICDGTCRQAGMEVGVVRSVPLLVLFGQRTLRLVQAVQHCRVVLERLAKAMAVVEDAAYDGAILILGHLALDHRSQGHDVVDGLRRPRPVRLTGLRLQRGGELLAKPIELALDEVARRSRLV